MIVLRLNDKQRLTILKLMKALKVSGGWVELTPKFWSRMDDQEIVDKDLSNIINLYSKKEFIDNVFKTQEVMLKSYRGFMDTINYANHGSRELYDSEMEELYGKLETSEHSASKSPLIALLTKCRDAINEYLKELNENDKNNDN